MDNSSEKSECEKREKLESDRVSDEEDTEDNNDNCENENFEEDEEYEEESEEEEEEPSVRRSKRKNLGKRPRRYCTKSSLDEIYNLKVAEGNRELPLKKRNLGGYNLKVADNLKKKSAKSVVQDITNLKQTMSRFTKANRNQQDKNENQRKSHNADENESELNADFQHERRTSDFGHKETNNNIPITSVESSVHPTNQIYSNAKLPSSSYNNRSRLGEKNHDFQLNRVRSDEQTEEECEEQNNRHTVTDQSINQDKYDLNESFQYSRSSASSHEEINVSTNKKQPTNQQQNYIDPLHSILDNGNNYKDRSNHLNGRSNTQLQDDNRFLFNAGTNQQSNEDVFNPLSNTEQRNYDIPIFELPPADVPGDFQQSTSERNYNNINLMILKEVRTFRREFLIGQFNIPENLPFLPCRSIADVRNLENLSEENTIRVIRYLRYLGGSNLKEACKFCLQALIIDELLTQFTWNGRRRRDEVLKLALCRSKLIQLIAITVSNEKYGEITKDLFVHTMMAVIDLAKQRNRNRNPRRNVGERPLHLLEGQVFGDELV